MNIENAQYVADGDGNNICIICTIDGKQSGVPIAEGNSDYNEIMRQVAAGELTIADAE